MRIVLHLGYPKTGTTWMQRQAFARQPSINNLGKPYRSAVAREFAGVIADASDDEFAARLPDFQGDFASRLDRDRINLFSNEGFIRSTYGKIPGGHDVPRTARRLRQVFSPLGEVTAFVLIRNHTDALYSHYNQFAGAWRGYGMDSDQILPTLRGERPDLAFILDNFQYSRRLAEIEAALAPDRFKWCFYEDFARDNLAFMATLLGDLGATFDRGVRITQSRTRVTASHPAKAFLNRLFSPGRPQPAAPRLDKGFFRANARTIKTYYRDDLLTLGDAEMVQELTRRGYL